MIYQDGLNYDIKSSNSAEISVSSSASGDIFIPRSIKHKGREYIITGICPNAFSRNKNINSVIFSDDSEISSIEKETFCESSITNVVISPRITRIGFKAFSSCLSLQSITFSPNSGLMIIENSALSMSGLISIEIPSHVRQIDPGAFNRCDKLKTVTFPEDSELCIIGGNSFSFCSQLSSFSVPSRVQSIGSTAFSYCHSLKTFTFSEGSVISNMDYGVFSFTSIEHLSIPVSLKYVKNFFGGCERLQSIEIFGDDILLDKASLGGLPSLRSVSLPNAVKVTVESGCGNFALYVRRNVRLNGNGTSEHMVNYIDNYTKTASSSSISRPTSSSRKSTNVGSRPHSNAGKNAAINLVSQKKNMGSSLATAKTVSNLPDSNALAMKDLQTKIKRLEDELADKNSEIKDLQAELNEERSNHNATKRRLADLQEKLKGKSSSSGNDFRKAEIEIWSPEEINQLEKVKKIGRGATSKVLKVSRNVFYALKIFNAEVCKSDKKPSKKYVDSDDENEDENDDKIEIDFEKMKKFFYEYELLNQLDHPNVVKTFGFCYGNRKQPPSILLEYCPFNLRDFILKRKLKDVDIVRIIVEICNAMKYVHQLGIIHRDLKPENILLSTTRKVKLSDFGISRLVTPETQTESYTQGIGTLQFMAPELLSKRAKYNEKVDVYAYGVVVYFILTGGELPNISIIDVGNGKKAKIPRTVNKFSQKLIYSCWSQNPNDRPSFAEIGDLIAKNGYALIDDIDEDEIISILEESK
ncbi:hypothetical protein M9Y10_042963 [Tritrichomonas musculus]|uniref:Protein kinase domain-containing protein n=1 Tax=Tritrichomonas musculus TaxID=1915356 RepID=A0ABR2JZF4_9EUKA